MKEEKAKQIYELAKQLDIAIKEGEVLGLTIMIFDVESEYRDLRISVKDVKTLYELKPS